MKPYWGAILIGNLLASGESARATEFHSHGVLGLYSAKETGKDQVGKSVSNDQEAILGRLFFDANHIAGMRSQFTLDIRDRYDSFGVQDKDRPRLVASNDAQVRQLAIKYPFDSGKIYGALGRVPIMDAAVLANDGVDLAYRVTGRFRLGSFAGLYPELRYGIQPQVGEGRPQVGLYGIYDDKSNGWEKHTLISSALISRGKAKEEGITANGGAILGTKENPTFMWYANAVHQASPETRYNGLAQLELSPRISPRNIWLGWYSQVLRNISTSVGLVHIDSTGYDRQRDAFDKLRSSTLTRLSMDVRHKLDPYWTLLYDGAFGIRANDQKTRIEAGTRVLRNGLLKSRLNIYGGGAVRKNYLSQDMIMRSGLSYVWDNYDLGVHQQFVSINREGAAARHNLVTDITGSTIFYRRILGTFTFEYAQSKETRVLSGMAGIGFRFGSGQDTPPGQSPVPPTPVERL